MKNKYYVLAAKERIKAIKFKIENNGYNINLGQTIIMYENFISQLNKEFIIYDNSTIRNIKRDLKFLAKEIKENGWWK